MDEKKPKTPKFLEQHVLPTKKLEERLKNDDKALWHLRNKDEGEN